MQRSSRKIAIKAPSKGDQRSIVIADTSTDEQQSQSVSQTSNIAKWARAEQVHFEELVRAARARASRAQRDSMQNARAREGMHARRAKARHVTVTTAT